MCELFVIKQNKQITQIIQQYYMRKTFHENNYRHDEPFLSISINDQMCLIGKAEILKSGLQFTMLNIKSTIGHYVRIFQFQVCYKMFLSTLRLYSVLGRLAVVLLTGFVSFTSCLSMSPLLPPISCSILTQRNIIPLRFL
jgi:hypothetical protein